MTLDDYKLWTGETMQVTDEQFEAIVEVASGRLGSFLCLGSLPEPLPKGLEMVLADFIYSVQAHRGPDAVITNKRVRNFTISFASNAAANAFAQIARQYGDILEKYSDCGSTISAEGNRRCCYGCV